MRFPAALWISALQILLLSPATSAAEDTPRNGDLPLRVAGLDSLSSATLGRALAYLEVRPSELGFDKLYADDDTFRLALVEEILGDPLRVPGWQKRTTERLRESIQYPAELAGVLGELAEAPAFQTSPDRGRAQASARPGVNSEAEAVATFVERCRLAENSLEQAFARLTPEDRRRVLVLAPAFWGDSEDPADKVAKGALHRELEVEVDTTLKLSEDPILDAAVHLDRRALTQAGVEFVFALERLSEDLGLGGFRGPGAPGSMDGREPGHDADRTPAVPEGSATLEGVEGPLRSVHETPWGLLVIGDVGPNTYSTDALRRIAFVVDLGGDDVYRGRAASAVGGLLRPFSAVVDRAGDDLYEAGSRSYCVGGALFGVAALVDLEGNDVYRAGDGSIGAGFFGAGFLVDGGGTDIFEGRNLCQGSGAFGMGALLSLASPVVPPGPEPEEDRGFALGFVQVPGTGAVPVRYDENDTYLAARQSQGFASTFGIGLLYDATGNDIYRAGGRYLHRPLLPDDFQSLSQGFSIGFRPRAGGGIGVLMDEQGNDFYDAEVYAQGASYWYSLGLLFDGAGNDRYLATQYAQGAGIHLAAGSLWDRGGDDHYVCKLGVTQGTAHDLSVGFQLDESGNDYYVVSDGQGMSITNSSAIFIDQQGNDVYATPGVGQGTLTWARGFCGAGIFLDLEGRDTYPGGGLPANGSVWSPDLFAVGIDLDRDIVLPAEVVPDPVLTAADSARTIPELFDTASLWEVGSAREKVRRARAALLLRPTEAMDHAIRQKLDTQDGLVYRTLVEVAKALPDSFAARVLPRLRDPDLYVQRNVISLLGELKRREARPIMEAMLRERAQERHWPRLIQALGTIGDPKAAPSLRPFLSDAAERRRIVSASALGALKDTLSVPTLVNLLEDPILTVRSAASAALVSFRSAAVLPLVVHNDPVNAAGAGNHVTALRTLGQIAAAIPDTASALELPARAAARELLMDVLSSRPRPAGAPERAAAVRALLKLGDPETVAFVRLRMRDESDPLVRRAFLKGLEEVSTREAGDRR